MIMDNGLRCDKCRYYTDSDVFLADSVGFADILGVFADSLTFRENLQGDPRRPEADDAQPKITSLYV